MNNSQEITLPTLRTQAVAARAGMLVPRVIAAAGD
jgi:hypothetical protein